MIRMTWNVSAQTALAAALCAVTSMPVRADCIDRGVDGVQTVLDHLYQEMGQPEPTEENMAKLDRALFTRDRDAKPQIPNDVSVSYSEFEGGINGGVSCMIDGETVVQPFRWTPHRDLELEARQTL